MIPAPPFILSINAGSSTVRFALFRADPMLRCHLSGKIDRLGDRRSTLTLNEKDARRGAQTLQRITSEGQRRGVGFFLDWLEGQPFFPSIQAVGHRLVHGMKHSKPERVTAKLLAALHRITLYDPEHLPRELELIEALARRHPSLPQVACFDTAFHRNMPAVAKLLSIPRRYARRGVERYGFHGLSYAFLMEELRRIDPRAAKGRVILAHLGSGASLAAVHRGQSIDTTMGFTPVSGVMMGTRSGDLDPGLSYFLSRSEGMTPAQFQQMVNHDSGLRGVSETSSDLRDLAVRARSDARAAEAIDLFCYQVKKAIGALAAALHGLDTLIFAGGIGENAAGIRERICEGLDFLGVRLNQQRNASHAPLISPNQGSVAVRVIHTDEERMIARSVARLVHPPTRRKRHHDR